METINYIKGYYTISLTGECAVLVAADNEDNAKEIAVSIALKKYPDIKKWSASIYEERDERKEVNRLSNNMDSRTLNGKINPLIIKEEDIERKQRIIELTEELQLLIKR